MWKIELECVLKSNIWLGIYKWIFLNIEAVQISGGNN